MSTMSQSHIVFCHVCDHARRPGSNFNLDGVPRYEARQIGSPQFGGLWHCVTHQHGTACKCPHGSYTDHMIEDVVGQICPEHIDDFSNIMRFWRVALPMATDGDLVDGETSLWIVQQQSPYFATHTAARSYITASINNNSPATVEQFRLGETVPAYVYCWTNGDAIQTFFPGTYSASLPA